MVLDPDSLRRQGYCVARGVFAPAEINQLRERLSELEARIRTAQEFDVDPAYPKLTMLRGDLACARELQDVDYVAFDERVIACVKRLVGPRIVYHGDSTAQWGEGPRGFHKDSADRGDPNGVDWCGDYGLIRMGVYLQDHRSFSGGLKIRRGSHRCVSHHRGRATNVDTTAGDVAFWYLTTSHSGNVVRLRGAPGLCLHPRLERLVPQLLRVREEQKRMSIFCTFGVPGVHLDHYIDYQSKRTDVQRHWRWCDPGETLQAVAAARGIAVRRPIPDYGQERVQRSRAIR